MPMRHKQTFQSTTLGPPREDPAQTPSITVKQTQHPAPFWCPVGLGDRTPQQPVLSTTCPALLIPKGITGLTSVGIWPQRLRGGGDRKLLLQPHGACQWRGIKNEVRGETQPSLVSGGGC